MPAEVNMFIFEFLTLGMVSNKVHIATLPKQAILIEIASTVDQYLLESLPIIKCLPRKHLTWNVNNFIVSSEVYSPIQIVCRYLDLYTKKAIDDEDIFFDETVAKQYHRHVVGNSYNITFLKIIRRQLLLTVLWRFSLEFLLIN